MNFNSIGDLASDLILAQASARAKTTLSQLSQELTTGITSNVKDALRSDLSPQLSWERTLASRKVLENTLSENLVRVQAKQLALGSISEKMIDLANDISTTLSSGAQPALAVLSKNAASFLDNTVSQLNAQAAGKSLFSGTETNTASLASAASILTSVKSSIAGAVTNSDIIQGVRDWMNDPVGGFQAVAYTGSLENPVAIRLGLTQTIEESTKADHAALKSVVENSILAALSADDAIAPTSLTKSALLQVAADGFRTSQDDLIGLRAEIGFVEAELTKSKVLTAAEISLTQKTMVEALGVDEFEVASKLQAAELQLEKIYSITARSARLSLLEYLR